MAARPWVTPAELVNFTDYQAVEFRSETRLEADIRRAEAKVIAVTNNHFDQKDVDGNDVYEEVPQDVKLAVLLCAELYAKNAADRAAGRKKSETFDDYSYESADTEDVSLSTLDLDELLKDYVLSEHGCVQFRMRKL